MQTIAIDDPTAWASVSLPVCYIVLTHNVAITSLMQTLAL